MLTNYSRKWSTACPLSHSFDRWLRRFHEWANRRRIPYSFLTIRYAFSLTDMLWILMFKGFNGEAVDHLLSVIAKHGRPLNILVINGTVDDVKAKIAIAVNNRRQVARRRPRLEEGSQPIDPNQSQSSQSAARLSTSSSSQSDVSVGVITVTVACVPFKEGTGQWAS